mmetsp:Transcript_4267/g.6282  ORF Transcript_4267/g.6282 Transcript_4267/m.6282 type:complete len:184 (+) Transcript_4267:88-639(+)
MSRNEEELDEREFKAIFQCFDSNGDKWLDADEISILLRELDQPKDKQTIQLIIKQVKNKINEKYFLENENLDSGLNSNIQLDKHPNEINEDQFVLFMKNIGVIEQDPVKKEDNDILTAFRYFDHENDGTIELKLVKDTILSLGEVVSQVELNTFLKDADFDQDGRITFEEFKSILKTYIKNEG